MKSLFVVLFGSMLFFSGNVYSQCTNGSCDNGQGTYLYDDGKYVGQWKNGLRHGQGTWIGSDGTKYIGEWKDDSPYGKGKFIYPDGSSFEGTVKNWEYVDGYGTQVGTNFKYVGWFKNGKFEGQGEETMADGTYWMGVFKNGQLYNGTCRILGVLCTINSKDEKVELDGKMVNGTFVGKRYYSFGVYEGEVANGFTTEFDHGAPHGKGILKYGVDGGLAIYKGQFYNGSPEGEGEILYPDGSVFKGTFKKWKKEGRGILSDKRGKVIQKGIWHEDNFVE